MARVVVDSSVLLARVDDDDEHHEVATEIVHGIDVGELPTGIVTETVTIETLNHVHRKGTHESAIGLLDRIVEGAYFDLVYSPRVVFSAARAVFRQYEGFAFGDAMLVGYMQQEDIEYLYSFDDDFDAVEGLTRLNSPSNPFR